MHLDVIGVFRAKRRGSRNRVTKQQTTRIDGNEEPLVRIERNGIRAFESVEQLSLALVQHSRRAVRAIDVKPQLKLASNVSYLIERVDNTRVHRACTANYAERPQTIAHVLSDLLL